jgi:penicillin-binding protein 1A
MTRHQRQLRRRRQRPKARNKVLLVLALLVAIAATAILSLVGYIVAIAASAPDINQLKPIDRGQNSILYAADGSPLGYVQSDILRTPVPWADMPVNVRRATVAIEDKRFYEHGAIDYEGILRAAVRDIGSGRTLQGGSTITQQLVRALYIQDPKRDFKRKIREAQMASELEKKHDKTWILWQYLNDVPYGTVGGRTAIGIQAASQIFFAKDAKDLTLPEAALLAGLPQAPTQYNPFLNPTGALDRRNAVLRAMAASQYISEADATSASAAPLGLHRGSVYTHRREQHFFDYVQEQLVERYGAGVMSHGGLKVYTTIDPKLQDDARAAMKNNLYLPSDPASAIVSIDPKTGYIRAMADSATYKESSFNYASQGHRQPGSSFKPFVLTSAILQGMNPDTTIYVSKPLSLNIGGYIWNVKTFDNTYLGATNITEATLHSDNTVYAQLDVDVGPKKVAETAHMMGITSKLQGLPAEGLGGLGEGVSPLEMADAYATLAAGGVHSKPLAITRVVFPGGRTDDIGRPQRNRVFSDGVAMAVTKVLEQNIQRGTAVNANYGCTAAAKTGTTDNFNDAWLMGYTPTMTTAVWVGYPNALQSMTDVHGISVQGGSIPAQIWHDYMTVADPNCGSFPPVSAPAQFSGWYGAHSAGSGGFSLSPRGGGAPYGGYRRGYNPQLYATPPQGPPKVPPPAGAPTGGGVGPPPPAAHGPTSGRGGGRGGH